MVYAQRFITMAKVLAELVNTQLQTSLEIERTFSDRHSEFAHPGDVISPTPTIVPLNLLVQKNI